MLRYSTGGYCAPCRHTPLAVYGAPSRLCTYKGAACYLTNARRNYSHRLHKCASIRSLWRRRWWRWRWRGHVLPHPGSSTQFSDLSHADARRRLGAIIHLKLNCRGRDCGPFDSSQLCATSFHHTEADADDRKDDRKEKKACAEHNDDQGPYGQPLTCTICR